MKEMVFHIFQKVWSELGHFFNFWKISCGHPRDACGSSFAFYQKFSKHVFISRNYCFDERNGFRQFSEGFRRFGVSWGTFWIFEKFPVVPPLLTLGLPLVPPLHFTKNFQNCFYQSKVIVLMKELVFDNFQKVWSRLRHFLILEKIFCQGHGSSSLFQGNTRWRISFTDYLRVREVRVSLNQRMVLLSVLYINSLTRIHRMPSKISCWRPSCLLNRTFNI